MKYFVDQYAKDDTLAPKDPKLAALVNQRLYFDATTLYSRLLEYFVSNQTISFMHLPENYCICLIKVPVVFSGQQPDEAKSAKLEEALSWLNAFLHNHVWVAGQYMTIADIALVTTVSTAEVSTFLSSFSL